jgi:hypothetical protein
MFGRIPELQIRVWHSAAVDSTISLNCPWFRIFYQSFHVKKTNRKNGSVNGSLMWGYALRRRQDLRKQ